MPNITERKLGVLEYSMATYDEKFATEFAHFSNIHFEINDGLFCEILFMLKRVEIVRCLKKKARIGGTVQQKNNVFW